MTQKQNNYLRLKGGKTWQTLKNRETLVLFDVGSVLVKLDSAGFYRRLSELSGLSVDHVQESFKELDTATLEGRISENAFYKKLQKVLKMNIPRKELEEAVALIWPDKINEMIQLKKDVYHAGYSIGIFSNIAEFVYRYLSQRYQDVFELYEPQFPAIYSYKFGAMKPEGPMYDAVKSYNVKGYNKVILIDDKDQYLKVGVQEYGWCGIHFTAYIDASEPTRIMHPDTGFASEKCVTAVSVLEVRRALERFGLLK